MKNNIILTGMPACGKTLVGIELAKLLPDYTLFDTDSIIQKTTGLEICEIFSKFSEDYFRKLEYDTIKMICTGNKKIVSTGGGAFENPDNRITLLKFGTVIYLKSDIDVLYYRLSDSTVRPLLQTENPREKLKELLKKREENYLKAHIVIDVNDLEPIELAVKILENINEKKSKN